MRLLVDGRTLSGQRTGVGQFLLGLLDSVTRLAPDVEIEIASDQSEETARLGDLAPRVRFIKLGWGRPRAILGQLYAPFWMDVLFAQYARASRPDVILCPNFATPLQPIGSAKIISVIHDIIPITFPDDHPWYYRLYFNWIVGVACRASTHICVPSQWTAHDLLRFCPLSANKITVISEGVDLNRFRPAGNSRRGGRYFLLVGGHSRRKNIKVVIQAWRKLRLRDPAVRLVVVGKRPVTLDTGVEWAGYVSDAELIDLYAGAVALCYPSLYEGFGLPPLEAMACGTPVIVSNSSSLPEVVGDAGLLVDPNDEAAWEGAMERVLSERGLADALRARGFKRVKRFSWDRVAERVLHLCALQGAC